MSGISVSSGELTPQQPMNTSVGKSKVLLNDFNRRADVYAPPAADCADISRDNIAPIGGGTIRMRRVCAGISEPLDIVIGCDDLSGGVVFKTNANKQMVDSQCPGASRQYVTDVSVDIKIPMYLDRLLLKTDLLEALMQSGPVAQTTMGDRGYTAWGITSQVLNKSMPRFYVEFTPIETASDSLTGVLFFPFAELMMFENDMTFDKKSNRVIDVNLRATLPVKLTTGTPSVVYGIWQANNG